MFGRLDRYVTRVVLGSYGAGLLFVVMLFSLIDLLLSLSRFLDAAQKRGDGLFQLLWDLAGYYLLFLPIELVMLAPFVTVIAGMFAVARLASTNELVPMLATGRSIVRALRPLLLVAGLAALSMVACWEFVIPRIAEPLQQSRALLDGSSGRSMTPDLVVELGEEGSRRTLFVGEYEAAEWKMHSPALVVRGATVEDVYLLRATTATWDAEAQDWRLEGGRRVTEDSSRRIEWLGADEVTPDLLWRLGKEGRETVALSYTELLDLRELRPQRRALELAYHSHLTFPLANLILLFLALPFAVNFERGSRVERVVLAILLCAAYLVTDLTCQNLGRSLIHPVLAAWLPTILFGSFGLAFFGGIRT